MLFSILVCLFVLSACSEVPENLEDRAKYQIWYESAETLIEYPEYVNVVLTEFEEGETNRETGVTIYNIKADISWDGDAKGSVSTEWTGRKGKKFGFLVYCDGCVPVRESTSDELYSKWRIINNFKTEKMEVLESLSSSLKGIEVMDYEKLDTVKVEQKEESIISEETNDKSVEISKQTEQTVVHTSNKSHYIPVESRVANLPIIPKDRQIIKVFNDNHRQKLIDTYPVLEWDEDPWYSDPLPVQFGELKGELHIDLGHPIGVFMYVKFGDQKVYLSHDFTDSETGKIYLDDAIQDGYRIEATPYDFNRDGIDEIVVAVTDQALGGMFNIFSFTYVENMSKINPFKLELKDYVQAQLWLNGEEVFAPVGSQGDGWSHIYTDNGFYKR